MRSRDGGAIQAANAALEITKAIIDTMDITEITTTMDAANRKATRTTTSASDAAERASEYSQDVADQVTAWRNADNAGGADTTYIKRAAAEWVNAADKYVEAYNLWATFADDRAEAYRHAAAEWAALDSAADPYTYPVRAADKHADAAAAWAHAHDAYAEAADKHADAAAAWKVISRLP